MRTRTKRTQRGFTLIELLIVVAIIGIIAAILIPNLIDALQKARQKRTVADLRNTGTAMMSWLTDQASAAAAGGATRPTTFDWVRGGATSYADIVNLLKPSASFFYMQEIPQKDAWKNDLEMFINTADILAPSGVLGLRSAGRDREFDTDTYDIGSFIATDYDRDIVWADGYFVRAPGGSTQ